MKLRVLREEIDLLDFIAIMAILLRVFELIDFPWYVVLTPIWVPWIFVIVRSAIVTIWNRLVGYGELEDRNGYNPFRPNESEDDNEYGGRA